MTFSLSYKHKTSKRHVHKEETDTSQQTKHPNGFSCFYNETELTKMNTKDKDINFHERYVWLWQFWNSLEKNLILWAASRYGKRNKVTRGKSFYCHQTKLISDTNYCISVSYCSFTKQTCQRPNARSAVNMSVHSPALDTAHCPVIKC